VGEDDGPYLGEIHIPDCFETLHKRPFKKPILKKCSRCGTEFFQKKWFERYLQCGGKFYALKPKNSGREN